MRGPFGMFGPKTLPTRGPERPFRCLDTNHIFSESLSSGDDNDRDEYLQKDKDTHTDKGKYKVLPRPNACYIFEKQRVQGYQIWHFLPIFPLNFPTIIFRQTFSAKKFHQEFSTKHCPPKLIPHLYL